MRNLTVYECTKYQGTFRRCIDFAKKCGLPISKRLSPTLYYAKSKSAWGMTLKPPRGKILIAITSGLVDDWGDKNRNLPTKRKGSLCSVIFHELAHTCPGSFDHGKSWKKWVKVLNDNGTNVDLHPCGKNPPNWER